MSLIIIIIIISYSYMCTFTLDQQRRNSKTVYNVHVVRNTAHWPSTQVSYTASWVRPYKENQSSWHKLQPDLRIHSLVRALIRTATDEFNVIPWSNTKITRFRRGVDFVCHVQNRSRSQDCVSWKDRKCCVDQ